MKDLYKILSGTVMIKENGLTITVGPFSFIENYMAESHAEEKYIASFERGDLTEDECVDILINNNIWTEEDVANLTEIPKNIEQMKIDYFNLFYSEETKKYIADNIRYQEARLNEIFNKKNCLSIATCESVRDQAKISWLVENCSYLNKVKIDYSEISLMNVLCKYSQELLDSNQIRQIAKSNYFRAMWTTHKSQIIEAPISDMKISLLNWVMVYDNVYESPECPSDKIIEDDLALDGWFIVRRRKQEDERKKNAQESKLSDKMSKAGEVFLPARNIEEAKNIYEMNSQEGKRRIKLLNKDLDNMGSVEEGKLTSVSQDLGMAKNRAQISALKGRK